MNEVKPYDLKVLVEKLKAKGLDVAEEAVKILIEEVSVWVVESAQISATPFDDIVVVAVPAIKKVALEQADKIDGVKEI